MRLSVASFPQGGAAASGSSRRGEHELSLAPPPKTTAPTLPRKAVAVAAHAAVAAVARPIRWASQVPTLRTGPAQQLSSGAPLGDTRVSAGVRARMR